MQNCEPLERKGHFEPTMDAEAYFEECFVKLFDTNKNKIIDAIDKMVEDRINNLQGTLLHWNQASLTGIL